MSLYTEEEFDELQRRKLRIHLETFVPLLILELLRQGGPVELDRQHARHFGEVLASHGDALLFPTRAKVATTDRPAIPGTPEMAGQLARYLAVMAFSPGGVTFVADEPVHFEIETDPTDEADDC
jgi:hypothetical protein